MGMKFKQLDLAQVSVKVAEGGTGYEFEGYASTFGNVDSYGDTIVKGAYAETIDLEKRSRPVALRWNHYGPVIGKWLEMKEDENGLYVKGSLTPGHSVAEDAAASLKHGAISGLSIGYAVHEDDIEYENSVRVLKKIKLFEISVVEEPADNHARISDIKSADSLKDIESILREVGGFSRDQATALVGRVKSFCHGERDSQQLKASESFALTKLLTDRGSHV